MPERLDPRDVEIAALRDDLRVYEREARQSETNRANDATRRIGAAESRAQRAETLLLAMVNGWNDSLVAVAGKDMLQAVDSAVRTLRDVNLLASRPTGRPLQVTCNFCKRTMKPLRLQPGRGLTPAHNCPHGKRCKAAGLSQPLGPDCDACRGGKTWGFR